MQMLINLTRMLIIVLSIGWLSGCKKLVAIGEPINSITAKEVFSTDEQANSAMATVYSQMVNTGIYSWFSNGSGTMFAGLSADEFISGMPNWNAINYNRMAQDTNATNILWNTAYQTIYNSNSVIEGIAESTASTLRDSARRVLTGEAKFVRAFAYFYLVNFYGDVPLVLTIDFNKTRLMAKTPVEKVYDQIIADLQDARKSLEHDYSISGGARIRPSAMAATAMLARVYLYRGDYGNAAAMASEVIGNTVVFGLEPDPNNVFLKNSREAIWQLQQNPTNFQLKNGTPEGIAFLPNPLHTGTPSLVYVAPALVNSFEAGDARRAAWLDSTNAAGKGIIYFPYKYKVGNYNAVDGAEPVEYHMVLRLAEQYLIRAEAAANGGTGGDGAAVQDLNVLRARAGLDPLSAGLSGDALKASVAQERRVELFAEWGHRWLDLKRTGKAHEVLSQISYKQPWKGDYQLLYPIPVPELQADPLLIQNIGY